MPIYHSLRDEQVPLQKSIGKALEYQVATSVLSGYSAHQSFLRPPKFFTKEVAKGGLKKSESER
jgi:hypothetical protein